MLVVDIAKSHGATSAQVEEEFFRTGFVVFAALCYAG